MATGVQVWSLVPATNATADSNVNYAEGQAPSSLNDSARAAMASVAKWAADNNGSIITAGSSTAYTATSNQVEGSLTAGYTIAVQFHATNDSSATLAVDGLTAKPMQVAPGNSLAGGEFQVGSIQRFTYSTTGTGQWIANGYIRPVVNNTASTSSTSTTLTSTSAFTDTGISITVSTAGTYLVNANWAAYASVSVGAVQFQIWDGTTSSTFYHFVNYSVNGTAVGASVSRIVTNPAGAIKLSGKVLANGVTINMFGQNAGGIGPLNTIQAFRIA